ncbi:hypothetical protein ARALYDRAFT_337271 [Arabidopsis lyrata subsp. lyrata]|uniref:Uncharacterized protein n=1 Tax=Arabidopsis lyrata subsp. lyrata TaxID=81972 RepID=D7KHP3_ARALL|nr:hypothetical protein ARALYDRAFT_337271 [Arabidopsis lyrata subsp. lyrata]
MADVLMNLWNLSTRFSFFLLLQTAYSRISLIEKPTAFLCEKYTSLPSPQLSQILNIEASNHLNVFCISPSKPDDPEDIVSLEDEDDPELSLLVELLGKGYKMKSEDWTKCSTTT